LNLNLEYYHKYAQIEHQRDDYRKLQKELDKSLKTLQDEKERHKSIVLYLIQERKQLLMKIQEEKGGQHVGASTNNSSTPSSAHSVSSAHTKKLEQHIINLQSQMRAMSVKNGELHTAFEREQIDNVKLEQMLRAQEEDMNVLRQALLTKSRHMGGENQQATMAVDGGGSPGRSQRLPPAYGLSARCNLAILENFAKISI
jgi:hypothetical protein